ncbi:uncharacterized protein LTR77_005497 [Saxophila tyrrhenica]|uniref:Rhodopsin domain-containing protein n=1 Tax=Saxophila tyrrhenica TaxID=1690608 RepID=A0AAV9PAV6_9PEZI|nr:hypothetical protein LTR77_005497 [Saxophila tyrrhenica]
MASSASASAVPTGRLYEPLAPPFRPTSDTNRGAYALLTAVILVTITGLICSVKLQMTMVTYRKFRTDDIALMASLVLTIGYTIAICLAVDSGLGRIAQDLSSSQVRLLSQRYYASNILLYLSLASSKISVALLVLAIKPSRWIVIALHGLIAVSATWGVGAVLTVALQCGPTRWVMGPMGDNTCIDQYSGLIGLRIIDIMTDLALSILPAAMVWDIQMPLPKRLVVAFMFGLRLVTPILTAVALASYRAFYSAPTAERPFVVVKPSIWTSVVINMSVITACLPSIKRWLTDWAAGVANAGIMEPYELQHSSGHAASRSGRTSGLRSFGQSQHRSHTTSAQGKTAQMDTGYGRRIEQERVVDDGDSKKGLTDGILQTVDYHVEYEHDWDEQRDAQTDGRRRT